MYIPVATRPPNMKAIISQGQATVNAKSVMMYGI